MKYIFYRSLLGEDSLTPTEKVIYSFLVYKSLPLIDEVMRGSDENSFNLETLDSALNCDDYFPLYSISYRRLSQIFGISLQTAFTSVQELKKRFFIIDGEIHISNTLIKGGYFPLYVDTGLKGELLIFYSYLKSKADKYGGSIDTFKYKLAEDLHTTKTAITNLLNRLYKKGYAERLENGKLKVN